ncbi:MAG: caspase family protein [Muribaculaceae bacterium]|nr:caspase family protein [Muribaculaceae bacterium]
MNKKLSTFILLMILVFGSVYAIDNHKVTKKTLYHIEKLSTPTIKIGNGQYKEGESFLAGEEIHWSDRKQWMLVQNTETKKLERLSKRTSENKGMLKSLYDFFVDRIKGSTRGVYDYICLERNPDSISFPEKRIALIIGNQNYPHMAPLKSAQKDAEDISDALFALGFDIIELYDSDYSELQAGLNKFAGHARNYDVALVYFAGHGIQDKAVSYLLPVDYDPEEQEKGLIDCVSCNFIVQKLENLVNSEDAGKSRCRSRIFFFDACREIVGDSAQEIENMVLEGKPGTVILFGTQSGAKAKDGEWDGNSPFAEAFIRNVNRTASFPDMIDGLVHDTYYATESSQYPVKVGSLVTDFRFTHKPSDSSALISAVYPIDENTTNAIEEVIKEMSANDLFQKGEDHYYGRNGARLNYVEALKWYEQAALRGHVEAMYSLGYLHGHGKGTNQNSQKAFEWYNKAAEQGFAKAQYFTGQAFYRGEGVKKDIKKALEWYRKAAENGVAQAQAQLAQMYENGEYGNSNNYKEAIKWYREAANQGLVFAQLHLGDMYFYGRGVEKDHHMAVKWYEAAADQGSSDGMCNLGYMYEKGFGGLPLNRAEAYNLYYKAADQRNRNAQYNLGVMYENGTYVKKDLNEAQRWYRLAADQGDERAKNALDRLSRD